MKKALVFWFTGLSGSGKTTIVNGVSKILSALGKKVKIYDGDAVRAEINKHLTFSPEHIKENNKIIAELCVKDNNAYDYIFVPVISPFLKSRQLAKRIIGKYFYLIYTKASIAAVIEKDPKGLYKKALSGQINNFIGISVNVPYEEPQDADLTLDTEHESIEACVKKLINFINSLKS